MKPIKFQEQNAELLGAGEIEPLPAFHDGAQKLSCWKMSWTERLSALIHGKIWLCVAGSQHPPVWLSSEKDVFERGKPSEQGECNG